MESGYGKHWNNKIQQYVYRKVANNAVDEKRRECAERAAAFYAKRLGVMAPEVRWFQPEPHYHGHSGDELMYDPKPAINGLTPFAYNSEIFISCEVPNPVGWAKAVAHEMRHVFQEKMYGADYRRDQQDDAEKDACAYESSCPDFPGLQELENEYKEEEKRRKRALRGCCPELFATLDAAEDQVGQALREAWDSGAGSDEP